MWGAAASAVNVVVSLVAQILSIPLFANPSKTSSPVEVGPLVIVGATLLASVLAGALAGLLGKLIKKVVRWVVLGGAVVTVASLTAPWDQPPGTLMSTQLTLTLMHLVTGVLVTYGLARGLWTDDRSVR